jgi:hypothetical protein
MNAELDVPGRVQRGIQILDEKAAGWVAKIDLGRLVFASPFNCILGQVFGSFGDGMRSLFPELQVP